MKFVSGMFPRPALVTVVVASLFCLHLSPRMELGMSLALSQPENADSQEEDAEMTFDESEVTDAEISLGDDESSPGPEGPETDPTLEKEPELDPDGDSNSGDGLVNSVDDIAWQDIIVVVRKPFLKTGRFELQPLFGLSINDNLIQHIQFAGALNHYLTDVLAIGLELQYFQHLTRAPFDLVARQARRLPTVNKYNFGVAANFHYVPIYGKFAVLDKHIVHWETMFTAGVGITQSEVIPRDPAQQAFKNLLVTPNVGVGMRFFLSRFMTVNFGIRDYVFVDNFESTSRMEVDGSAAKRQADSSLVNNIIFQAGLSFWYPMSFQYTTFR